MLHFSRTLGLDEAKTSLAHALTTNTFPHALLVHGPEGVGQNALLLDLVDLLVCEAEEARPCSQCAGCLGRQRNNLDSLIFIMPLEKKEKASSEGEIEGNQVEELIQKAKEFHANPYGFVRTEKSRINIAQIRDLKSRLAFAEVSGRPRIVVLLWAETMPQEAANALLKTLEEPPANTFFLLSCEDRSSLLPTIVSRCTQIASSSRVSFTRVRVNSLYSGSYVLAVSSGIGAVPIIRSTTLATVSAEWPFSSIRAHGSKPSCLRNCNTRRK